MRIKTRVQSLLSLAGHYEEKKTADQGTAVKEVLGRGQMWKRNRRNMF